MAAANSRKKNKLGWIFRLLLLGVIVYIIVSFVQMQVELTSKQYELATLNISVHEQLLANEELKSMLDMRQDDEYIERVARDRLDYAFPDEKVFVDISGR